MTVGIDYIERIHGNGPVVITVPHDGDFTEDYLPRKQVATWTADWRDFGTTPIGYALAALLHDAGLAPSMVVQRLDRKYLDVNRPHGEDPYQDARLAKQFERFHVQVDDAVRQAYVRHGRCFVLDLHGFVEMPGPDVYDLVLGSDSGRTCPLGSDLVMRDMLEACGYHAVFSPDAQRNIGRRYRGGWTVRRVARDFAAERVEACQLEIAAHLRDREFLNEAGVHLVMNLAVTLTALMHRQYGEQSA